MTTTESAGTATADDTAPADTTGAADDTSVAPPLRLFGPRGRHRRPRPRKVLLAAGGLALAAGALSLVRPTPDSGLGSLGTPEAEPWASDDSGTDSGTGRSTNAAAAVDTVPRVSPSATSAMGGLTATPTAAATVVPTPNATSVPAALERDPATTIPQAPNATAPRPTATSAGPQAPPAAAPSRPAASPSPKPSSPSPSPSPSQSDRPGVCVPIIGLCVDPLAARDDAPREARTAPRHGG
ncbi:hypothetical protein STRCI_005115 [Streptomyces cinnabarinus]|uniref:Uncharacterized protein n=1 Tax=Streptomyces cinnabarinus TaxID=67287 RepID=A0ABY7KLD5_9ACTN|nr:hypothetical protein [Streptomyces cinnabarinus]WAZ23751.1 hypothetical protein STRCI_005115 [Streptomyces cinnabarinus]